MSKEIDFDKEIQYCNEQIAKYRRKRQELERKRQDAENEKIVSIVRSHKLSVQELTEFVNAFAGDKKTTTKESSNNV